MKTWNDFIDLVDRAYRAKLDEFPFCLILDLKNDRHPTSREYQQIQQIAQCHLLIGATTRYLDQFNQPHIQKWFQKSAQPLCARLLTDFHNFDQLQTSAEKVLSEISKLPEFPSLKKLKKTKKEKNEHAATIDQGTAIDLWIAQTTEKILQTTDVNNRIQRGAYFTDQIAAQFMIGRLFRMNFMNHSNREVAENDSTAKSENYQSKCLRFLDPAAGAGIFLVAIIRAEVARMSAPDSARHSSSTEGSLSRALSEIIERISGIDVLAPSLLGAHLNVVNCLNDLNFVFSKPQRLQLYLANTLADFGEESNEKTDTNSATGPRSSGESIEMRMVFNAIRNRNYDCVVGNPPFAARSSNNGAWIQNLLHGKLIVESQSPISVNEKTETGEKEMCGDDELTAAQSSYFQVNGQPLGEKKLWLHDDYVKFFRYAQWQIERNGTGQIAFVTNRGILDNVTFRGMRSELQSRFDSIEVLDLHGDSRNRTTIATGNSDQPADENIFPIETGIAIVFLSKSDSCVPKEQLNGDLSISDSHPFGSVRYASCRGSRDQKLNLLQHDKANSQLLPIDRNQFVWVDRDFELLDEYEKGWKLTDIFRKHWSTPVTARDHFVVAFERKELEERLNAFASLEFSDAEIRARYFNRTRSNKYQPGDSRSWKMAEVRKNSQEMRLTESIRGCTYRPFDLRWVAWHKNLIDWQRSDLLEHLLINENICLIGRRQSPPTDRYNYFFVTDKIVLDGILRSDNRGNETLFPLFVLEQHSSEQDEKRKVVTPNINDDFHQAAEQRWQTQWESIDLFFYIYGLVQSKIYQSRYSELLAIDFPRIALCRSNAFAKLLMNLGRQLVEIQLQKPNRDELVDRSFRCESVNRLHDVDIVVARGFPKWIANKIWINSRIFVSEVKESVWNYRIGGHQVARKWLRDRKGRALSPSERKSYLQLLAALDHSTKTCDDIDRIATEAIWKTEFCD